MSERRPLRPLQRVLLRCLRKVRTPQAIRDLCAALPPGDRDDQRRVIRALGMLRDEGRVQLYRGRWALPSITDCPTCEGRGWRLGTQGVCDTCKGSGWVHVTSRGHGNADTH